jgi:sorbose reductase
MNGTLVQPNQALKRDADSFLRKNVFDLFSLKGRTVVITGGARGIGLSFGFAIAEAGGNVAILDALSEPHEHYYKLKEEYGVKVELYK